MRRAFLASILGVFGGGALALLLPELTGEAAAEPPREGHSPDPPAVANTDHWVFEIIVEKSVVRLGKATAVTLKKAEATPRMMGRYALELRVGNELLDRLRFNPPLGGDAPQAPEREPGRSRPVIRANVKFFVRVAHAPRAMRLWLVDRATGEHQVFAFPPEKDGTLRAIVEPPKPDAGDPDAGPDAGKPDAGKPDGKPDAGKPDAGK